MAIIVEYVSNGVTKQAYMDRATAWEVENTFLRVKDSDNQTRWRFATWISVWSSDFEPVVEIIDNL